MKYTSLACAFILSGFVAAQAAEPAFVSNFGGSKVSVERGGKSSAVGVQTLLEAGDRVSAGKGSFVEVKYLSDNCAIRVSAGNSMVIGASSPCAAAADQSAAATSKTDTLPADAKIVPADAVIAAGSAQVIDQTGSITRVNLGDGLVELSTGQELSVGDTVFAGPGSTITLYYPATGCEYVVPSETYFAVAATAPCAASGYTGTSTGGGLQQSSTGVAGVTTGEDDDDDDRKAAILLAGAAVIGGGALAVIALSGGDDGGNNNPATPD